MQVTYWMKSIMISYHYEFFHDLHLIAIESSIDEFGLIVLQHFIKNF